MEPPTEPRGYPERKKQRAAAKQRRSAAAEELRSLRMEKATRSDTGGTSSGKRAGKGQKGKGKLYSRNREGKEICYSWNNKNGKCADLAPGQPCPAGRLHACQRCLSTAHRTGECPQSD